MDIDIIKDILNLEKDNGYEMITMGFKRHNNKVSIVFEGDANFDEIFKNEFERFVALNLNLYSVYSEEINKELDEKGTVSTIRASITVDDKGNCTSVYVPYVKKYKEGAEELISNVKELQVKLDENLEQILNDFVDIEDSLKEFGLILTNINNELKYHDFMRMNGRPIRQQKDEIRELLINDIGSKLLDEANELGYDLTKAKNKKVVFNFVLDNQNEIINLKISAY